MSRRAPNLWIELDLRTRDLTTLEAGAVMRLVMAYWRRRGPLPLVHNQLARTAGLDARNWRRTWQRLRAEVHLGFVEVDGHLWCKWLELALLDQQSRKLKAAPQQPAQSQRLSRPIGHNVAKDVLRRAYSHDAKPLANNSPPVEEGGTSRARVQDKIKSPSCSLGDSDSRAIATGPPPATNQGALEAVQAGPPAAEHGVVVSLPERLAKDLAASQPPPAPSRGRPADPKSRQGGGQRLGEALERLGNAVAARERQRK